MLKTLGFIGAGRMAREHARAAVHLGAEIATVVSTGNPHNIDEFKKIAPKAKFIMGALNAVLGYAPVDGYVVAASWREIPGIATRLLHQRVPALIEKPILLRDSPDPKWGVGANSDNKMIGYNRRFYDGVGWLRKRLVRGGLVSVDVAVSEITEGLIRRHGHGIIPHLLEFNSHTLDLVLHLFAIIGAPYAKTSIDEGGFRSVDAVLETLDGTPIHLSINRDDPLPIGIQCRFEGGEAWVLSPLECLTVYDGVEVREEKGDRPIRRYVPKVRSVGWEDTDDEGFKFKPGVLAQMRAFLEGDHSIAAGVEDALAVRTLINELRSPS